MRHVTHMNKSHILSHSLYTPIFLNPRQLNVCIHRISYIFSLILSRPLYSMYTHIQVSGFVLGSISRVYKWDMPHTWISHTFSLDPSFSPDPNIPCIHTFTHLNVWHDLFMYVTSLITLSFSLDPYIQCIHTYSCLGSCWGLYPLYMNETCHMHE